MRLYKILTTIAVILVLLIWQIETQSKPCLEALVCAHTRRRRCGFIRDTGELRRFLDRCDMLEFNCEYKTNFEKIKISYCNHIPPI
ncbi:hypothetical protein PYW07_008929 [Mythimna separata]|uniref:Uncharacterized protein n=1 Tax=Mythimna separata TaxID=271217 RepID=A0AAD8DLW5_MYTSE|nr:hypothetical protein PYW07_008929 [Mythimna separata]